MGIYSDICKYWSLFKSFFRFVSYILLDHVLFCWIFVYLYNYIVYIVLQRKKLAILPLFFCFVPWISAQPWSQLEQQSTLHLENDT